MWRLAFPSFITSPKSNFNVSKLDLTYAVKKGTCSLQALTRHQARWTRPWHSSSIILKFWHKSNKSWTQL
ncbi:hypothetical protein QQP08_011686 [Theobroma cacao]|nr:hypothetical protein QQP08_011686 [Theobroma cacao]